MEDNTNSKYLLYQNMTYCDYFNVKARGFTREIKNLEHCDQFCTLTNEESGDLKNQILQKGNLFPDNKNVLYVHIPFCATRCDYCPYYVAPYDKSKVEEYIEAIEAEIDWMKDTNYVKTTEFQCLYFGGGTPSILSAEQIKRLVSKVFKSFSFVKDGEFTYESNPATLTKEKMLALKECGINRISLGIQTFNDRLLKEMNCAHDSTRAKNVIRELIELDFLVNTDFIYGLINQSENEILEDIRTIKEFNRLKHITFFPLRIMANTNLEQLLYDSEAISITEHFNKLLKLDKIVETNLVESGFKRELVPVHFHSNLAEEHKYVSTGTRVLGVGAGAGTLIDYGEFYNHDNIDEYIRSIQNGQYGCKASAPLSMEQSYERYILFCIIYMNRSLENIKDDIKNSFENYYGIAIEERYEKVLNDMLRLKFIKMDSDGKIIFTNRMWHVLGQVRIGMPSII